jgi:hypothetical protein
MPGRRTRMLSLAVSPPHVDSWDTRADRDGIRAGHSQGRAHVQAPVSLHLDSRWLPQPEWQSSAQSSPRHLPVASPHAGPDEPGQIHVQAAYSGHVLLDARRCESLPGLFAESDAATPAPRRSQPPGNANACRAQKRRPEPSYCEARKCSHIALESKSEHHHHTVVSRATHCSGSYGKSSS